MKHFIFLFHIFSFLTGFTGIILCVFAYIKYHTKLIKHYILFMAALTTIVLEQSFIAYEIVNIVDSWWLNVLLNIVEYLAAGIILYFLPLSIYELTEREWTNRKKNIFKLLALFQAFLLVLYYATAYQSVVTILASGLLFLVIFYSVGFLLISFKEMKSEYTKKVLKLFMVTTILFLPYMYLDTRIEQIAALNKLFPYGLLSVPAFYLIWNVLSIYFGVKYFKSHISAAKNLQNEKTIIETEDKRQQFFERFNITNREKEIILLLIEGYSYNQLAEELIISMTTVKTHIHNIYKKVGVKNKIELIHQINKG